MSDDRNTCGYEYRVDSEFFDEVQFAMTACADPCSGVAIASTLGLEIPVLRRLNLPREDK